MMKKMMLKVMGLAVVLGGTCEAALTAELVVESPRDFRVVATADVVVVGGTSAGVSAAVASAAAGARTYLVAPRPYLGEDIAGTLNLFSDGVTDFADPVAHAIWEGEAARLPFTYRSLTPSCGVHVDDGKLLNDGRTEDAEHDSVQFNDETATVVVDLGKIADITLASAHTFRQYQPDFGTEACHVSVSTDGQTWSKSVAGVSGRNNCKYNRTLFRVDLGVRARYLRFEFVRRARCKRQLVSEIAVYGPTTRRRVPTPREVKSSLDELLIAKGIPHLTGAVVTDVLGDGADGISGVVIANRAGRQVIRARRVIDATARGTALVAAGGRLAPLGAKTTLHRFILSAHKPAAPGLSVRELPLAMPTYVQASQRRRYPANVTARLYDCTFAADLPDDAAVTWAAVEQRARDLTADTEDVDAADEVVAPQRTVTATVGGLVYIGATRDYAAARQAGRAAALSVPRENARTMPRLGGVAGEPVSELSIAERRNGLHGYEETGLETVSLGGRRLPVLGRYDVVVLGGGSAGSSAAIGALRGGARTLVVDYLYNLGGISTVGSVGYYWYGFRGGFTAQIDKGARATNYLVHRRGRLEWFRREIRRLGGDIWFGAMGCGAVMSGDAVAGIVVATSSGRGVVLAKRTIDTTGAADVAAAAGERTAFVGAGEFALQTSGPAPLVPGASYVNTDWSYIHDGDALDLWMTGLRARRGGVGEWDMAQVPGSRERRHLACGGIEVTPLDVALKRRFRDVIAHGRTDFDTHGPTVADVCFASEPVGRKIYELNLPYRALLPAKTRGLLVASLGLNVHRDAQPFVRMVPDVQNIGYAAGCAAAQSVKDGVELAALDVRKLQRHLVEIGQIPADALTWTDDFRITDERLAKAVAGVGRKYHDSAIVFAAPARAIPLLRRAYAEATDPKAKLCYAHVLGILRDGTGAATLAEQLAKPEKDRLVINDTGKESFGNRMTACESQLIALGRTGSDLAVPLIRAEIGRLSEASSVWAARAVMLACEAMPRREFAPELAAALRRPGVGGHFRAGLAAATPRRGFCDNYDRREEAFCPRELHLARALWLCGDHDGVAKRTLEAYAHDPRAVYAAHARAVLGLHPVAK